MIGLLREAAFAKLLRDRWRGSAYPRGVPPQSPFPGKREVSTHGPQGGGGETKIRGSTGFRIPADSFQMAAGNAFPSESCYPACGIPDASTRGKAAEMQQSPW